MMRSKLKNKRLAAGYTQQQIANAVGIDRTFYSNIENGHKNCRTQIWLKIADVLEIPEDQLISYIKEGLQKSA